MSCHAEGAVPLRGGFVHRLGNSHRCTGSKIRRGLGQGFIGRVSNSFRPIQLSKSQNGSFNFLEVYNEGHQEPSPRFSSGRVCPLWLLRQPIFPRGRLLRLNTFGSAMLMAQASSTFRVLTPASRSAVSCLLSSAFSRLPRCTTAFGFLWWWSLPVGGRRYLRQRYPSTAGSGYRNNSRAAKSLTHMWLVGRVELDARTQSPWGTVRTFIRVESQFGSSANAATGSLASFSRH